MRRYFTSELMPKIFLNGMTATVKLRKINVDIPVVLVAKSSGFGPTCLRYRSHKSNARGMSELMKMTSLGKVISLVLCTWFFVLGALTWRTNQIQSTKY